MDSLYIVMPAYNEEENIEKVLNDEITPETAVDNMAKTINSALEKYNKSNN